MCLAIPAKIETIEGTKAEVVREADAHAWIEAWLPGQGWVELDPTPSAQYALVHAGFAIQRIDPEEAEETYQLLEDTGITIS